MRNILLVEPGYSSKFPPLGLMKIATYHRDKGDSITFVRGHDSEFKARRWDRIYVASLYTWDLPITVKAIQFYASAVSDPKDIVVGGVGATLLPDYIESRVRCTVIKGQIDKPNVLEHGSRAIAKLIPDYRMLQAVDYEYRPTDTYFARITKGCIRSCKFCAVPLLEKDFGFLKSLKKEVREVDRAHGPMQNLVVMDNNVLGVRQIDEILREIAEVGFEAGAKRNGRMRSVDFNQGLDARLIAGNPKLAKRLSALCLNPVRLAYDTLAMDKPYKRAISLLVDEGFQEFTNYMLFNFNDTPQSLFQRMKTNVDLSRTLGVRVTGFPMRFIPMDNVERSYVSEGWRWRYLRGIQCVLQATRGLVSPNPPFFARAFGNSCEEFVEILAMPDHYIMYRDHFEASEAKAYRARWRRLGERSREELLGILQDIHKLKAQDRSQAITRAGQYRWFVEQHYVNGRPPKDIRQMTLDTETATS